MHLWRISPFYCLSSDNNEDKQQERRGYSVDVFLQYKLLFQNNQRYLEQRVGITSVEHVGWKAESLPPPSEKLMVSIVCLGESVWIEVNKQMASTGRNAHTAQNQTSIWAVCALLSSPSLWICHRWRFMHPIQLYKEILSRLVGSLDFVVVVVVVDARLTEMLSFCFKGQFAISIPISITFGAGNLWHTSKKKEKIQTKSNPECPPTPPPSYSFQLI